MAFDEAMEALVSKAEALREIEKHGADVYEFFDDWVDSFPNLASATLRAIGHRNILNGQHPIVEQKHV